jgi:hypothetical protein
MPVATEKPWLLRPDWAQGYADPEWSTTKDPRIWLGIVFCLISLPGLNGILHARGSDRYWAIVVAIFPLVGAMLVVQGIAQRGRAAKFRGTRFVMRHVPGVLGGALEGEIESPYVFPPATPVNVTLSCISVTHSDDSRWEKVVWQSKQTVTASFGGPGTVIPVAFTLPVDAPASDTANASRQILWRLTAQAALAGTDFRAPFLAPVFETPASDAHLTIAKLQGADIAGVDGKPAGAHLEIGPSRDGGVEFHLGAARNKGMAAALSLFGIFFMAGGVFFAFVGAHFHWIIGLIPLFVAGGIGFFLFAYSLWLWLGVTTMRVRNRELQVHSSWLGISRTRVIPAGDIEGFNLYPAMQQGENVWYDVRLQTGDRRSTTIASGMEKPEAEWCVAELKKDLGL